MSKTHQLVYNIALAAILTSFGVVLKLLSFTTLNVRVTLFDTILIYSGIILGPIYGLTIGFSVDVLDFFLFPKGFPFSYIILIGTILSGLIPGVIVVINKFVRGTYRLSNVLLLITIVMSTTISFLITTYQMYIWLQMGFLADLLFRTIVLVVKWPIQFYLIKLIYEKFYDKVPLNSK